jgi:hypothetical protein
MEAILIGIVATAIISWYIHYRTSKVLNLMTDLLNIGNAVLISRVTPEELHNLERLVEDTIKTGQKRGTLVQRTNGIMGNRLGY